MEHAVLWWCIERLGMAAVVPCVGDRWLRQRVLPQSWDRGFQRDARLPVSVVRIEGTVGRDTVAPVAVARMELGVGSVVCGPDRGWAGTYVLLQPPAING